MDCTVEHEGHKIKYLEHNDKWEWGGKAFSSLGAAAKAISKHAAESRRVNIDAILLRPGWSESFLPCKITSLDADGIHAWIVIDGIRTKQRLDNLVSPTVVNNEKIEEYHRLASTIKEINTKCRGIIEGLDRVDFEAEGGE